MTILLAANTLSKDLGEGALRTTILHDVNLELPQGTLTLLIGPSGSGKTTLVTILAGLARPTRGSVTVCGERLDTLDEPGRAYIRRRTIGFIFQTYNLFPALTACQNVALAYRMRGHNKKHAEGLAAEALAGVGLSGRLEYRPDQLSSGQKQRVAIARALAGHPPIVIGDEPTAALDSESAANVMELLQSRVTNSCAVLIVTHDHRLERYADRVIRMEDGRIVEVTQLGPDVIESPSSKLRSTNAP